MVSRRRSEDPEPRRRAPATTPEARERQLQAMAYDLAEKQLRDGTASSQVITQLMKSASSRERLEQERMSQEVELLKIRAEAIASEKRVEQMYGEAMRAFATYSGNEPEAIEADSYDD